MEGMKVTFLAVTFFKAFWSEVKTLFKESRGTTFPAGLPRWDIRTTDLAPFSKACFMVGIVPTILLSSWTSRFLPKGTLLSI
ncbi:hypothetical protein MHBO_000707 [Bonamia ostreae]|uniref:Uncharacterized protein n=1 Tax=Bonamia ostreae TaxID=126728 RepID=A0ABV2AH33_9EUKA